MAKKKKQPKVKMSRSQLKQAEEACYGSEPKWDKEPEDVSLALLKALNWYGSMATSADLDRWVVDYANHRQLPPKSIKLLKASALKPSDYIGAYARLAVLGAPIGVKREAAVDEYIKEAITHQKDKQQKLSQKAKKNPTKTIIELTEAKFNNEYLAPLEMVVDAYLNGDTKEFDIHAWYEQNNGKAMFASKVADFFDENYLKEIELAIAGEEDYAEAYGFLGKKGLKAYRDFIQSIVEGSRAFGKVARRRIKAAKKPKKVSAGKKAAKFSYLEEYPDLKLVSVSPETVIGASELWIYNTATKKFGRYVASNAHGLDIKGATILNFDQAKSKFKKIANPSKQMADAFDGKKTTLNGIYKSSKGKERPMPNRSTNTTILLKAIK